MCTYTQNQPTTSPHTYSTTPQTTVSHTVQETKLQESHVDEVVSQLGLEGWHVTFNCSTAKKGYSGTATLCR